jgi:flavin reductase (DIM6/NTAB) family NADH-FMN oxidoreductase RutF
MAMLDERLVNGVMWLIPNALVLVGAHAGEEWNAMTTSWISQVSMEPVSVAVSIDKAAYTHKLVMDGGFFSVNLWSPDDTRVFVKFSKPATREGMELNGRRFREGETGAPIFEEAIAWFEVEVARTVDVGTHTLFIGEVVGVGRDPEYQGRAAGIDDTRMKYGGVKRH